MKNTFVHVWYPFLEEYQCRQRIDSVLLGFLYVGNFHERYIMLVTVVIDVLQFTKDFLALLLILVIYLKRKEEINAINLMDKITFHTNIHVV